MGKEEVGLIVLLIFYGFILLIGIGVQLLVCYFLYKPAKALPETYRSQVSPGQAFLLLIPLFNLVWLFIFPKNLSQAYQSHFHSMGRNDQGDCGQQLGQYWAICTILSIVPCLGAIAGIAGLVLMILYLVKINSCANLLSQPGFSSMQQKLPQNYQKPVSYDDGNPYS